MTRRMHVELLTAAEVAIRDALLAVEELPADTRLTDAVVLLGKAQGKVAEYIDERLAAAFAPQPASPPPTPEPVPAVPEVERRVPRVCYHQVSLRRLRDDGKVVCACGHSWATPDTDCAHPRIHRHRTINGDEVCLVCTAAIVGQPIVAPE